MAFKPNYGRDRAERARAARARSEEKKRKRDEKTALRKAQRAEADPPLTNPTTGIAGCCARAASGQEAAVPPRMMMNSRRLMATPKQRLDILSVKPNQLKGICAA